MNDQNVEYYERRAKEEFAAAAASTTESVASAHRLLAIEYAAEAKELRLMKRSRPILKIR